MNLRFRGTLQRYMNGRIHSLLVAQQINIEQVYFTKGYIPPCSTKRASVYANNKQVGTNVKRYHLLIQLLQRI